MTSNSSTPTTNLDSRHELQMQFQDYALNSLAKSIQAFNDNKFYAYVLKKFQTGIDLTNDLPELKKLSKDQVEKSITKMIEKSLKTTSTVWELSPAQSKCFITSIRSSLPEGELITQFDIEYAGIEDYSGAKILIRSKRRNVNVQIIGADAEIESLSKKLILATMIG